MYELVDIHHTSHRRYYENADNSRMMLTFQGDAV
jgi:hypothetical protein